MKEIILAKYGEIILKGGNRPKFENILMNNIRNSLKNVAEVKARLAQATIYVEVFDEDKMDIVVERLSKIFGIVSITRAVVCEKDIEDIKAKAKEYLKKDFKDGVKFKVEAKRSDKQFPLNSPQICMEVGGYLDDEYPNILVDVHNPEVTVKVEVRDFGAYVYADENKVQGQGGMPRKKIDKLVEFAKGYGAKGLAYIAIAEDGTRKSSFAKFMTDEEMDALVAAMDGKAGDLLLFAADKKKLVYDVLGALRLELAKQMDLLDKNEYRFVWVTEFPLLEWSEEENRFTAMHHPFTMLMEEDLPLLDTDPGKVRAKAYDIVLNGNEIGGGSVRIHQDDIQERMFEALGFTKEAAHEQFGFLLDAFKYGVPPHAGLAYGLDRLVMLMAKVDSIRDVIAFPKVKDASCLMTQSPSRVSEEQLKELELEVRPEEVTE